MKRLALILVTAGTFIFSSCSEDDEVQIIDSSQPVGTFTVDLSGTFVDQNSAGSAGMAELGTDSEGTTFLRFTDAFQTNLGTGTVTVFLSTSDTYTVDPMNGNPDLIQVGPVLENGELFFRINSTIPSNFTHVILWCGSAGIPFGNAQLN